jgi:hypothetical protein
MSLKQYFQKEFKEIKQEQRIKKNREDFEEMLRAYYYQSACPIKHLCTNYNNCKYFMKDAEGDYCNPHKARCKNELSFYLFQFIKFTWELQEIELESAIVEWMISILNIIRYLKRKKNKIED